MKSRRMFVFAWVFLGILAGCLGSRGEGKNSKMPIPTITPSQNTLTPPKTSQTNTLTPSPPPELYGFPDLLFNVAKNYWNDCELEINNQVWLSKDPYTEAQPILAEDGIDFNYPSWSPDGEWIAYIRSQPGKVPENFIAGLHDFEDIYGTESVWIMKVDGSESFQVSDNFPRIDYYFKGSDGSYYCRIENNIFFTPIWSPDRNYIVFVYSKANDYEFHLVDLRTLESRVIEMSWSSAAIVWMPNSTELLIINRIQITRIYIPDMDHVWRSYIPFPQDLTLENTPHFRLGYIRNNLEDNGEYIIGGSFYLSGANERSNYSLREVNLNSKKWVKLNELNNNNLGYAQFGDYLASACDDKGAIYFVDIDSWEVVSKYDRGTRDRKYGACRMIDIIQSVFNQDVVSRVDVGEDLRETIWIVQLDTENKALGKSLFSLSSIGIPEGLSIILDYSWRE